jgi:hypothetical protein
MCNSLLYLEIITELKLMVLRVINQLINELSTVISRLEEEEPEFRPRIHAESEWE